MWKVIETLKILTREKKIGVKKITRIDHSTHFVQMLYKRKTNAHHALKTKTVEGY